jgi:hypothetical protein
MTADEIIELVTEGSSLDAEIRLHERRLKAIREQLAKSLPAGDYVGRDGTAAKVVCPGPAIKPDPAAIGQIRSAIDDANFKILFFHVAQWKPVKDIRAKAEALLSPGQHRKFLELAEVPSNPYVIFS